MILKYSLGVIVGKKLAFYVVLVHNLLNTTVPLNVLLFLMERHILVDDMNDANTRCMLNKTTCFYTRIILVALHFTTF